MKELELIFKTKLLPAAQLLESRKYPFQFFQAVGRLLNVIAFVLFLALFTGFLGFFFRLVGGGTPFLVFLSFFVLVLSFIVFNSVRQKLIPTLIEEQLVTRGSLLDTWGFAIIATLVLLTGSFFIGQWWLSGAELNLGFFGRWVGGIAVVVVLFGFGTFFTGKGISFRQEVQKQILQPLLSTVFSFKEEAVLTEEENQTRAEFRKEMSQSGFVGDYKTPTYLLSEQLYFAHQGNLFETGKIHIKEVERKSSPGKVSVSYKDRYNGVFWCFTTPETKVRNLFITTEKSIGCDLQPIVTDSGAFVYGDEFAFMKLKPRIPELIHFLNKRTKAAIWLFGRFTVILEEIDNPFFTVSFRNRLDNFSTYEADLVRVLETVAMLRKMGN